ncbi:MAG TPA: hypothetical protein VGB01_02460, partial [candidate division Zixibacteria bacterium]
SMMHVAIPEFSSCGNLWNRFPQVRLEYKAKIDDKNSILFQAAILRPFGADITPTVNQTDEFGSGELANLPFVQGRVSANVEIGATGATGTIGGSFHFGQEDFRTAKNDTTISEDKTNTMAFAGDAKFKYDIVTISGEAYLGENLTMLFSNAYLMSDSGARNQYKYEGVKTYGGWGEIFVKPKDSKFSFGGGVGLEFLDEADVSSLLSDKRFPSSLPLWKNMTIFGTVIYAPFDKVSFGLEFNNIKTTYKKIKDGKEVEEDADNNSISLAFKFDF